MSLENRFNNIPPESWIAPFLERRPSPMHGEGVFTNKPIPLGEVVIIWGGAVMSQDEFSAGIGLKHSNVGIDEHVVLANLVEVGLGLDDYMNHSCDPNLWLIDEVTLVARRLIAPNEELTIDYATEVGNSSYVMARPCNCGSSYCRKTITGEDWRLPELHERYGSHFSPFIRRRIEALIHN